MRHNTRVRTACWSLIGALFLTTVSHQAAAQPPPVPRPFPAPSSARRPPPVQLPESTAPAADGVPTEESIGVPLYPNAHYLDTFDAGRGQTFHLFGTNATFQEMVRYYSVVLDEGGDRVFDAPATHQFDTSRFRDERMSYRPSVTIKDYTWNGAEGYLNPIPGADPPRYRTIIQITTPPPGEADR